MLYDVSSKILNIVLLIIIMDSQSSRNMYYMFFCKI